VAIKTLLQTFPVDVVDRQQRTPLMYASISNKVRSVELLLKLEANPRLQDGNGRTALLWAAYYGHSEVKACVDFSLGLRPLPCRRSLPGDVTLWGGCGAGDPGVAST
jgi:hypothetical protein